MGNGPLRILVCGGRDYADHNAVTSVLNVLHAERGIAVLIHGAAPGADDLAGEWAHEHGVPVLPFPANWRGYGKGAGPIRNRQMLEEGRPDGVVAFPGGTGTANMIRQSEAAGVTVWRPIKAP